MTAQSPASTSNTATPALFVPELISCDMITSSPIQPRTHFEGIEDLAASIQAQGLISPVVVRVDPQDPKRFELVAGERRLRAFRHMKATRIPAAVRQLSDKDAHDITAMENLEREDLTPLEESRSIAVLLEGGAAIAEVADRLGRAPGWVARRARIAEGLSKDWKKAIEKKDSEWSTWSASMFEQIARLSPEVQKTLIRTPWTVERASSASDLRDILMQHYKHELKAAPFSTADDGLFVDSKTCLACEKRTGHQADLFDDLEELKDGALGRCLDGECWNGKSAAAGEIAFARVLEMYGKKLVTVDKGHAYYPRGKQPWGKVAEQHRQDRYSLQGCKKTDPKVMPVFVLEGHGVNTVVWMKKVIGHSGSSSSPAATGPKSLKVRRVALDKRRDKKVRERVLVLLEDHTNPPTVPLPELLVLVSAFGSQNMVNVSFGISGSLSAHWKYVNATRNDSGEALGDVSKSVQAGLNKVFSDWMRGWGGENNPKDVARICEHLAIDLKTIRAEVCKAIPEPKSWKDLNADGTPKKLPAKKAKPKAKKKAARKPKAKGKSTASNA